jgi:hypothetical protein
MFLGYAGNYASGFADELAKEDLLVRLERLSEDATELDAGEHVSRPAATRYVERSATAGNDSPGRPCGASNKPARCRRTLPSRSSPDAA